MLLLNNENVSMPLGKTGIPLSSFSCLWKWIAYHPRISKQSPQDNDTSNNKISPSRFLYMGYITFLDLMYHFPSSLEVNSCWVPFYLWFKWLYGHTVETLLRIHPTDNCCPVIQKWAWILNWEFSSPSTATVLSPKRSPRQDCPISSGSFIE